MASFSTSDKGASPGQDTAPGGAISDGQGVQGSDTLRGVISSQAVRMGHGKGKKDHGHGVFRLHPGFVPG